MRTKPGEMELAEGAKSPKTVPAILFLMSEKEVASLLAINAIYAVGIWFQASAYLAVALY